MYQVQIFRLQSKSAGTAQLVVKMKLQYTRELSREVTVLVSQRDGNGNDKCLILKTRNIGTRTKVIDRKISKRASLFP